MIATQVLQQLTGESVRILFLMEGNFVKIMHECKTV